MKTNDPDAFFTYMRMNPTTFDELLEELRPHIERQSTNMREPISAEERLAVTLRWVFNLGDMSTAKRNCCLKNYI